MLLYFVKSKNDTKCKNFVDLLCSYVNTFILLYFLRFQEGGGGYNLLSPPLNPPLSLVCLDSARVWLLCQTIIGISVLAGFCKSSHIRIFIAICAVR